MHRAWHRCPGPRAHVLGSLRIVGNDAAPEAHDHVDFVLASGRRLRFRDPRRFGSILWTTRDPLRHKLLAALGPEPLGTEFGTYITLAGKPRDQNPTLVRSSRKRLGFGEMAVLVQVRRNSVTVQIDSQTVTQFDGDLDQLAAPPDWLIPNYSGLLVGAHIASYRVTSWVLEPVAPAPRLGKTPEPPALPGLPSFP